VGGSLRAHTPTPSPSPSEKEKEKEWRGFEGVVERSGKGENKNREAGGYFRHKRIKGYVISV
jgi:hypothetical protein